jgi:hypothetical protein
LENVEWTTDIPGLGWSSPIVSGKSVFLTTVITDGKAKQPQTGVDYSNDYVAELEKQGIKGDELMKRLNQRDFELPSEVSLHYWLYSLDLNSGKVTGSGSSTPVIPPEAVIARTVSVRKLLSPTASAFTSTSPISAFSPTISTARKSGIRR